jgi:site-specific recombinase XerD
MGELIKFEQGEWGAIKANWPQLKDLALKGVGASSRRSYDAALDAWRDWYDAIPEPRPRFFSKANVHGFRASLQTRGLAPSTINVQLAAIRKLAAECADNNLIPPELAAGIARVKGVKRLGVRTGNWLTAEQCAKLIAAPDGATLTGKRDRALLAVLIGCGLRRAEACALTVEHIQQRDGRWAIVDIIGKGGRTRTVPMGAGVKALIDSWTSAAAIAGGCLFRPINRGGHVMGARIGNAHSIWLCVEKYAGQVGIPQIAPHDLRRTFAKLAHKGKAALEQIQLSLGHASITTTERYLGVRQDFADAPCDRLAIELPAA